MKRWRRVIWTFLFAVIACLAFGVWAKTTRSGLVFEKDQYWKQILDNSPFVSKNMGPYHKYMKWCEVTETGTLRGLKKSHVESQSSFMGDITETWHGPCYVEVSLGSERKIIWGNKLTKVEHQQFHSIHVTIE
jgi:hypothetical protein